MENALQEGHCVRNRWQVIKKIGQGAFGEVYHCKDRKDGSQVAIKIFSKEKDSTTANQLLKLEVSVLRALQGENYFPKFVAFGKTMRFDYLAMELLGPSLSELRRKQPDRKFSLSTTLRLGEMMLKCIQALHRTGFVHRDIKPSNFVMGLGKNTRKVFLLDFGLSRQILLENGEMRPARPKASFQGTPRYASINVLKHREAGRHDDLISLFYVLSEFAFQELPWKTLRELHDVAEAKDTYDHQIMVKEFPDGFQHYFHHIKDLTYCDEPNYELLYSVFDQCIKLRGVKETDPFDFEISDEIPFVELQKKGSSLSAQSQKTQSDVLIVKCDSIEKPENVKEQLNNMKPRNGLIENFGESNLTEDCSKKKKEGKNIENLNTNSRNNDTYCKDTKFITPPGNDCQLKTHASITSDLESAIPNNQNTTHTTQLTAEPKKECTSHQNANILGDSILPGNSTFEQKEINQEDNFQLHNKNLCEELFKNRATGLIGSAVPIEELYLKENKPIRVKYGHTIRRSVSQPARTLSHIKNVLNEFDKSQEHKGLPRCRSCSVISFSMRSDLKRPLKQQALLVANTNKVQNVAALKKIHSVHIDSRQKSLPIILTHLTNLDDNMNEPKAHSESAISLQRYSVNKTSIYDNVASIINVPDTSQSMNLNLNLVPDSKTDLKKSLSDSNLSLRKYTKYFQNKSKKDIINYCNVICTKYMPESILDHQETCERGKETNPDSLSGLNTPNFSRRKSSASVFENVQKLSSISEKDCHGNIVITNEFSVGDNELKNENACNENSFQKNENATPQLSALCETNINTDSRIQSSFSNVNDSLHSSIKEPTNLNVPLALTNVSVGGNSSSESFHKLSNSTSENILQSTKNETPQKEVTSEETALLDFNNCNKIDDYFHTNENIIPQESKSYKEITNPSLGNKDLSLNNSLNLLKNNHPQIDVPEMVLKPIVHEDNMSCSESINKLSRSLSISMQQSIGHVEQEHVLTSEAILLDSKTCNETDNSFQNNEFISPHASESDEKCTNLSNPNKGIPPNVNDSSNLLVNECIALNVPAIVISLIDNENVNQSMNEISKHMPVNEIQCTENETSQKVLSSGPTILLNSEICNETDTFQINDPISQKSSESSNKCLNSDCSDDGLCSNENFPLHLSNGKHTESTVPDTLKFDTACENSISEPNKLFKSMSENKIHSTDNMTTRRRRQRENSDDKYVKDEKELNLNFTRRRQRPTSQIYEMPPPVFESHSQKLSFPSALLYHKTENSQNVSSELLYPPPDEPPPNHCLPSRRVRYRRTLNYMTTTS